MQKNYTSHGPDEQTHGVASGRVVILGTGGTIAGTAEDASDNVGYRAAQLGVEQLLVAIPPLANYLLETEQVAQLDSKDMDFATWQRLALRVEAHLARPDVAGLVITHGTDTLEETAYFLQRVLAPKKPVVLTAAMRPATALQKDGPQNLLDAVTLALDPRASGVLLAFAGQVHSAEQVRKIHSYKVDAFASVDGARLACIEEGQIRWLAAAPVTGDAVGTKALSASSIDAWPRIEIVMNYVGANGSAVRALLAQGVDGLVVAGTGNGSLSVGLEAALREAQSAGVSVWRSTRCDAGPVTSSTEALPSAGALSPVKARIELLLTLLWQKCGAQSR
ncbi:asparaginase [Paucibacter sp. Y2R2-4]|uniref:asparaginase n=1 Tax=Paucibacter sp. Y2R2-4 TaxID=2893553 RepID=UPI0021E4D6E7|nr:asparaginase [Paucibacter sp. Y2R2-4]MCV2348204.1 asparaginase [Paucibacter sp. Y2R2-4]